MTFCSFIFFVFFFCHGNYRTPQFRVYRLLKPMSIDSSGICLSTHQAHVYRLLMPMIIDSSGPCLSTPQVRVYQLVVNEVLTVEHLLFLFFYVRIMGLTLIGVVCITFSGQLHFEKFYYSAIGNVFTT